MLYLFVIKTFNELPPVNRNEINKPTLSMTLTRTRRVQSYNLCKNFVSIVATSLLSSLTSIHREWNTFPHSSNASVLNSQKVLEVKYKKKQKQSLTGLEIHVTNADITRITLGIKRYLSTIDIHTRSNVDVATCAILCNLIIPNSAFTFKGLIIPVVHGCSLLSSLVPFFKGKGGIRCIIDNQSQYSSTSPNYDTRFSSW